MPDDPRIARALRDPRRFAGIVVQLALLLVVFSAFSVEEIAFTTLATVAFAAFCVHYWLPLRWKQPFWLLVSAGGAFLLLDALTAAALIGVLGLLYVLVALPIRYAARLGLVALLFGGLLALRATTPPWFPHQTAAVIGSVLMFRLLVYLYDLRQMKGRPSFRDFATYFLMLPNHYFLLFPVVDFQTLRKSFLRRDVHVVAQQGVDWIVRGTIQLLLYRVIYFSKPAAAADEVDSPLMLLWWMVSTYLLYLRVSGQFHVIIGLLNLFGYDLPESHRRYFLASSLTDFWRRINIYWKDFMVKLVYFPVYFRLRKRGDVSAQLIATSIVFLATWFLHSYQYFWMTGHFLFSAPDVLFWALLGGLVAVNLLLEIRRPRTARGAVAASPIRHAAKVVLTFLFLTVIWSMWNSPSLGEWWDLVRSALFGG